jgi:hypothetical protein
MDYDDEFEYGGNPRNKWAAWWNRLAVRADRLFRWPKALPPKLWLLDDLSKKSSSSLSRFVRACWWTLVFLGTAFEIASIIVMYRSWNTACSVPLNAFVLVAAALVAVWAVLLVVLVKTLSQMMRLLFVAAATIMAAWTIVGIVWLAQSSAGGCQETAPMLFGMTIAFVVSFAPLNLILLGYFAVQMIGVYLLQKRVVKV